MKNLDTRTTKSTLRSYPPHRAGRPTESTTSGRYRLRFAESPRDLWAIQALRFRVFNLELGEGLAESWATWLDRDRFDRCCHHLLVEVIRTGEVVGTYRLQTRAMAAEGEGFYVADEFDLDRLPEDLLEEGVELGRACIAEGHRNGRVLGLLWRGIASYLHHNHRRYFFGCASLTTVDSGLAWRTYEVLRAAGHVSERFRTEPLPSMRCFEDAFEPEDPEPVVIPKLFRHYLSLQGKIAGAPALDLEFKTADFLMIVDVEELSERQLRMVLR